MIDVATKKKALQRLNIIQGQLKGLQRMIQDEHSCVDVLTQISAIHEALRAVGKLVVRNHLESCVTEQIMAGQAAKSYDELMDIMYKLSK